MASKFASRGINVSTVRRVYQ
ncbi:hypothetical protein ABEV79_24630 [Bacillus licheniformis]